MVDSRLKQRDINLIVGFCRKSCYIFIPSPIIKLFGSYLLSLEVWANKSIGKYTRIEGCNNDICTIVKPSGMFQSLCQTVVGRNVVDFSHYSEHRWRLKILNNIEINKDIIIGIISNDNNYIQQRDIAYKPFINSICSHGLLTTSNVVATNGMIYRSYCVKTLHVNDIIEIYLTINSLKYVINGKDYGCAIQKKHIKKFNKYRLAISMYGNNTSIQILDYYNSYVHLKKINKNPKDARNQINYARSVGDISLKLKHYELAVKLNPNNKQWRQEYIQCLLTYMK